jgi:hypothetical protein
MYARSSGCTLLSFRVDIQRNAKRMLLFVGERMWGDHRTYALQIVHIRMWDHTDVCYFLKYPPVKT